MSEQLPGFTLYVDDREYPCEVYEGIDNEFNVHLSAMNINAGQKISVYRHGEIVRSAEVDRDMFDVDVIGLVKVATDE